MRVKRHFLKTTRRYRVKEDGATAVEFSIVALPFFVLMFGLIEISLIFMMSTMMDVGIGSAARSIRTGEFQAASEGMSESEMKDAFRARVCDAMADLFNCRNKLFMDVRTVGQFSDVDPVDPLDDDDEIDDGALIFENSGREDIVVVRAYYKWDLIMPGLTAPLANLPGNSRLLQSTVVLRNEPF